MPILRSLPNRQRVPIHFGQCEELNEGLVVKKKHELALFNLEMKSRFRKKQTITMTAQLHLPNLAAQ